MKRVATTCMSAVPFMFTVIPSGRTKEAIVSSTPSYSVVVLMFSGSVAAEEDVEKPKIATFVIF